MSFSKKVVSFSRVLSPLFQNSTPGCIRSYGFDQPQDGKDMTLVSTLRFLYFTAGVSLCRVRNAWRMVYEIAGKVSAVLWSCSLAKSMEGRESHRLGFLSQSDASHG